MLHHDGSSCERLGEYGRPSSIVLTSTGTLYAGGIFDPFQPPGVGRWDGQQWIMVGGEKRWVVSLAVSDSGALFAAVNTATISRIERWNGTGWDLIGEFSADTYRINFAAGELWAMGAHGLSRWNGTVWSAVGSFDGEVRDVAIYGGGFFVAGAFTAVDGVTARNLAYFDGSIWSSPGGGLDRSANRLLIDGDSLWIGGQFTGAGQTLSVGIARWDISP